jgi:hypothetical protein
LDYEWVPDPNYLKKSNAFQMTQSARKKKKNK